MGIGVAGTGISASGDVIALGANVTDRASVRAALEETILAYGGVDHVVVTAGLYPSPDREGRIPDERWGQRVAAVLQVVEGHEPPSQADIEEHLASRIARYKVPRFVHVVDLMQRSPSGKPDYGWATKVLTEAAGAPA
ncbi:MAG: hypothetical protein KY442_14005 [Proteobacteria bacterium]|nr:hypothetical protein [Pseudomonadota bacterium]